MATIDFNCFRNPIDLLPPPCLGRGRRRKPNSPKVQKLVERYQRKTESEQGEWLGRLQAILRETFPFLENSRDLTNVQIPQDSLPFLVKICFYRGLVIPGLIYKFKFTSPSEQVLDRELLSHQPFDYRVRDSLHVKTAGRFNLELFKPELLNLPTYEI